MSILCICLSGHAYAVPHTQSEETEPAKSPFVIPLAPSNKLEQVAGKRTSPQRVFKMGGFLCWGTRAATTAPPQPAVVPGTQTAVSPALPHLSKPLRMRRAKYDIALKAPHGVAMQCIVDGGWVRDSDINVWIKKRFVDRGLGQWLVYNDEVPGQTVSESHGHCKGILAWNSNIIVWLIHSIPNFPASFDSRHISDIGPAETIFGQSLICLDNMDRRLLSGILQHLRMMNPCVFNTNNPEFQNAIAGDLHGRRSRIPACVSELALDDTRTVIHVAKTALWEQDIYEHLAQRFGGEWTCETWVRGQACVQTPVVRDAERVVWPGAGPQYSSAADHSKYAVSRAHTFVGDMNRMRSQFRRGGGGVVVADPIVSRLLSAVLLSPCAAPSTSGEGSQA